MAKEEKNRTEDNVQTENTQNENENLTDSTDGQAQSETESLKSEVAELKDKYLRLYSEFENYKRRTAKEKTDFLKTANEEVLVALLPVLDDFERAIKSIKESSDVAALKEGINLIFNKLFRSLESKGLKPMETVGKEFNPELEEAITQIPAPSEDLKGKVVDEVEKGYYLNDKVIRFAKVVIGS